MISYKKFVGYEGSKYRSDFSRLENMNMLSEIILTHAWSPIVWKNNYALTGNFEYSDFLVLDFDNPGEESLDQVNEAYQDHKRIIATTRSHQIEKNGIICDRYRLIMPWDKRITDYDTYKYNYQLVLKRFPWADSKCYDGARFFYPSQKILYIDRAAEYSYETSAHTQTYTTLHTHFTHPIDGKIPSWCLNFINDGRVGESRNLKVYAVALELFRQGFVEADIRRIIMRAPINWDGIALESILRSARSKK